MSRIENPLFGDGDEYELEGRFDPEASDGSYEERGRQALEAGDRETAVRIIEEGYKKLVSPGSEPEQVQTGEEEEEEEAER